MNTSHEASPQPTLVLTERGERVKKAGIRIGAVASVAFLGYSFHNAISDSYNIEYGRSGISSPADPGDGIDDILVRDVEGISSVDRRDVREYVKNDPANIPTLVDGLQIGEALMVPSTVSR